MQSGDNAVLIIMQTISDRAHHHQPTHTQHSSTTTESTHSAKKDQHKNWPDTISTEQQRKHVVAICRFIWPLVKPPHPAPEWPLHRGVSTPTWGGWSGRSVWPRCPVVRASRVCTWCWTRRGSGQSSPAVNTETWQLDENRPLRFRYRTLERLYNWGKHHFIRGRVGD